MEQMPKMKRVLYVANLNPNKLGSMEEHALFVSRELRRRGHECYLGFNEKPGPAVGPELEAAGARVLKVYCGETPVIGNKAKGKIGEAISLYRVVKKFKIDVVHVQFIGLTNLTLWRLYFAGVKIVFTDHSSGLHIARNPLKNTISTILHFFISQRVAQYIAVSDFVRERLRYTHHLKAEKTLTLYNAVNLERFKPLDADDARKTLGYPLDKKLVCAVAMLIPEKGLQHLITAVALLVHDYDMKDLMAVIAGEGYYREELEQLVDKLQVSNNVRFLGRRSDVQMLIAAADIVVVPSTWAEAFGLIIAEAMACARPVVASSVGGIPELVEDGVTGRVVKAGDSKALSDAMHALLRNKADRERMGKAGHEKAKEMFNLVQQVEKLVDVYESL